MCSDNIKKDFPGFSSGDLTYLDSAATSLKPQLVIDALVQFYRHQNAPVHRGVYLHAEQATTQFEQAREKIANFIGAQSDELIFTSGTTDAINFVAQTWGTDHIQKKDIIVVARSEHHANMLPWMSLAKKVGATVHYLDINPKTFCIDTESFVFPENTKLVAIGHHSNVLGNCWKPGQLEKLINDAHRVGAKVLLDAAQSVGHVPVNFKTLDVDFMAFSGHKMFGPTGIGCLLIKKDLHDMVKPYRVGGGMVADVDQQNPVWQKAPHKFEAGTPPVAQAIGLAAAVGYFEKNIDFLNLAKRMDQLVLSAQNAVKSIPGTTIYSSDISGHILTFSIPGIHAHDVAAFLSEDGIAVRAGHHCAQPLHNYLGVDATVRLSFHAYNDLSDIEKFKASLLRAYDFFKGTS